MGHKTGHPRDYGHAGVGASLDAGLDEIGNVPLAIAHPLANALGVVAAHADQINETMLKLAHGEHQKVELQKILVQAAFVFALVNSFEHAGEV